MRTLDGTGCGEVEEGIELAEEDDEDVNVEDNDAVDVEECKKLSREPLSRRLFKLKFGFVIVAALSLYI